MQPHASAIPDIPLLVSHGIEIFLLVLLGWSAALGSYFGRKWAAARKLRSIENAQIEMAGVSHEPLWTLAASAASSDFVVLEGTLEGTLVQKMGGADRCFPAQRQGRYALIRSGDGERIDLTGEANILAGSFERFRLVDRRGLFSICERRLASGDHVVVKGKLKELDRTSVDDDDGLSVTTYRTTSKRRFALGPATGRDELLISVRPSSSKKSTPRAKLTLPAMLPLAALAGLIFIGFHWIGAKVATNHAWEIAFKTNGDVTQARRTIKWASIGTTSPADRDSAINAILLATAMESVSDPVSQSDFALLSARFYRYRSRSCRAPLAILQSRGHDPTTIRVAEDCGDLESAFVAARAHLRAGEFWQASMLLEEMRPWEARRRTKEEVFLAYRAHLLAGRLDSANQVLSHIAYRSVEFYGDEPRARRDIQHWLPCLDQAFEAHSYEGRREESEHKLTNIIVDPSTSEEARGVCSLLLADLKDGAERDRFLRKFVDGPQAWDRAIQKYPEHDWLGLEAETRRGNARAPFAPNDTRIIAASAPLGFHTFATGTDPTEWRALEALAALAHPSREQRVVRMKLAADLSRVAAVIGFEHRAEKWADMLAADASALRDQHVIAYYGDGAKLEPYTMERIEILRTFIHLRGALNRGETRISRGMLPKRVITLKTQDPETQRAQRELDAILAYVERGELDGLISWIGLPMSFTNHLATTNLVFAGLDTAKDGSGARLVKWLDSVSPSIALPVALLASRRITSERDVMLTWLVDRSVRDLAKVPPQPDSLYERAAIAYMRAGIAENLQERGLAQKFRDENSRILYALTRRETSLAIALTHAWE